MAVRGTFDLNDRPAVEGLGRIKRAGTETDAVLSQLGRTMDDVVSEKNATEARSYAHDLNDMRDAAGEAEAALRTLGTVDARPKVHLDGYEETMAKIDRVEARMRQLGTVTARPNVNPSQHGRVGGGGGGFGGGGGGLDIPFAGKVPWALVGAALGAAPPLIGGATSLIGSLGGAALGAGAIGTAGAATAGVSLGLAAPTTIASISGIKEASKALAAYQKQVIETGPNSKAAAEKLRLYNIAAREAPGATEFLRARTLLSREFNPATKEGQEAVAGIGTRGLNLGRQLLPVFAPISNSFLQEGQSQFGNFANFLNSRRSRNFYGSIGAEAINDLGPAEQTLQNVAGTIENIAQASRPFFHEGVIFLRDWTKGWKESTSDLNDTRDSIGGMVDDLKAWGHLGGAGFTLLEDLLKPASGPGTSMVDDLTEQLQEWDKWVKENPRQISAFFEHSAEGTEKIASALGKITRLLFKTGEQLTPLVEEASNLIGLLDKAGLLTPGALPLLLAGGAGVRAGRQGLGNRIRGGSAAGTGVVPFIGGAAGPSSFGSFGASRFGAPLTRDLYGTAYEMERLGGASRLGALGTVARSTKVGGAVETVGRGFFGSLVPYLALSGTLGAAGSGEGFLSQGFVEDLASGATAGALPGAKPKSQKEDEGLRWASMVSKYQSQRFGNNIPGLRRQLLGLKRKIRSVRQPSEGEGWLTYNPFTGENEKTEITQQHRTEAEALGKRRQEIRNQLLPETWSSKVKSRVGDITNAFDIRAEGGVKGAGRTALQALEQESKTFHGKSVREFDQLGLDWAKELAKANPKLKGVVNEMAEGIEARLTRMGNQYKLINGQILNVTESAWPKVRAIITSETAQAEKEAGKNLSGIEKQAFAVLKRMGYSSGQAQSIVHESLTGKPTKTGATAGAEAHHHGGSSPTINNQPGLNQATGGRLPDTGSLHDTIPIPGGGMAAGGELFVNRHTEERVNRILGVVGTSLGLEVDREGRAHSEQIRQLPAPIRTQLFGPVMPGMALGGRGGSGYTGMVQAARNLDSRRLPYVWGGGHSGFQADGYDCSGSVSYVLHGGGYLDTPLTSGSLARWGLSGPGRDATVYANATHTFMRLRGLGFFGTSSSNPGGGPGFIPSSNFSSGYIAGFTQRHPSEKEGGGRAAGGAALLGGAGGAAALINLPASRSGLGGFPGAAVDRSNQMEAAGLQRNINRILGRGGGGGPAIGGTSRRAVESQIARVLFGRGANKAAAAGIIGNAYAESSMDPGAEGTGGGGLWGFTSGAISLANLKKSGGGNWDSPAFQTNFMLAHGGQGLIPSLNRAGSPEQAAQLFMEQWERPGIPRLDVREGGARTAFSRGFATGGRRPGFAGWFAKGGHFRVKNPTLIGVGESGEETVRITPRGRGGTGSGGHTFKVSIDMRGAHIHGDADARRLAKTMADEFAGHIAEHLESSDGVPERALTG